MLAIMVRADVSGMLIFALTVARDNRTAATQPVSSIFSRTIRTRFGFDARDQSNATALSPSITIFRSELVQSHLVGMLFVAEHIRSVADECRTVHPPVPGRAEEFAHQSLSVQAKHRLWHSDGSTHADGVRKPRIFSCPIHFLTTVPFRSAYGSFCLKDSVAPFCPSSPDAVGDARCCVNVKPTNVDASLPAETINEQSPNSIETMVDVFKIQEIN